MPDARPRSSTVSKTSAASAYWDQSRRPLASLLFILPLLIIYEAGVLWMGPGALRNGADVWLRQLLDWISNNTLGRGEYFLLPVLTVFLLLAWHHLRGDKWRVSAGVLYGMAIESSLLGVALLLFAHFQARVMTSVAAAGELLPLASIKGRVGAKFFFEELVRYLGAGIYEELLFRLILFSLVLWFVRMLGGGPAVQMWTALVASSAIFSAAHYVGAYGEAWELYTFAFRFAAGAFFAVLFHYRGFGIAAGTHTFYDVLVGFR